MLAKNVNKQLTFVLKCKNKQLSCVQKVISVKMDFLDIKWSCGPL